jgi:hypothetical protein
MPDSSYDFSISNLLVNTGFVIVGHGLTQGQWGTGYPADLSNAYFDPTLNDTLAGLLFTTGNGTEGFLRLYPTLNHQTSVPGPVPDSETLYIGWNISESGNAKFTLTAPSPFKLTAQSAPGDPLEFQIEGAFGPDTCQEGYVWRDAFPGDHVCVLPPTRKQAAEDDAAAPSRVNPKGSSGPKSCVAGYVWRQAEANDQVCVTEATRSQAAADNAAAHSRIL